VPQRRARRDEIEWNNVFNMAVSETRETKRSRRPRKRSLGSIWVHYTFVDLEERVVGEYSTDILLYLDVSVNSDANKRK
jgi:hypothetical protein